MKKLLLLLFSLVFIGTEGWGGTIHIPFNNTTLDNTGTSYVKKEWSFTVDGVTFTINNANPSSGQIQANKNPGAAFYIYNTTAIDNIKKITIKFSSVGAKTPNNAYFNTADAVIKQAQTEGTAGTWDASNYIAEWTSESGNGYFRIDLNTNVNGTVKVEYLDIEFGGSDQPGKDPAGLSFPESAYYVEIGSAFAKPTLNNPNNLTVSYTSSKPEIAEVDATSGDVTVKAVGSTVITASTDGDETHDSGTAKYTLTVTGKLATYVLVEDYTTIPDGNYIIGYVNDSSDYYMGFIATGNKFHATMTDGNFDRSSNSFKVQSDYAIAIKKLDNGNYTLYSSKGYLNSTAAKDMSYSETPVEWTIKEENNTLKISPVSKSFFICCNPSANRFTTYANTSSSIYGIELYAEGNPKTPVEMSFPQAAYEAVMGSTFTKPELTVNPAVEPITYTSSNEAAATVAADGSVTLVAAGETTITAVFAGNDTYASAKANYKLTVKPEPVAPSKPVFSVTSEDVEYNTEVTITSENATQLDYMIEYNEGEADDVFETVQGSSVKLNITRDCTITVEGSNTVGKTEEAMQLYTIIRPAAPELTAAGTYRTGSEITATAPANSRVVYTVVGANVDESGTSETNVWKYTLVEDCEVEVYSVLPNGYRSKDATSGSYVVTVDAPSVPTYTFDETEKSITFTAENATNIIVKTYRIDGTVESEETLAADAAKIENCNSMRARFEAIGVNAKGEKSAALDVNVLDRMNHEVGGEVWTRVTSIDQITDDMEFVVLAHAYNTNGINEKDFYMSNNTWANSNKRAIKGKETTMLSNEHMSFTDVPDDAARIKLTKRQSDGKWLLHFEKFIDGTNELSGYLAEYGQYDNGLKIENVSAEEAVGFDVEMITSINNSGNELTLFAGALQFKSSQTHPYFKFNSQNSTFAMYTDATATVNQLPIYLYTRSLTPGAVRDHYTATIAYDGGSQDMVKGENDWSHDGWFENFEKGEVVVNVTGFDGVACTLYAEVPADEPAPADAPAYRVNSSNTHVHLYPKDNVRLLLAENENSLPMYLDSSRFADEKKVTVSFKPFDNSTFVVGGEIPTSIEEITADSDATAEYYTLQGIRVANPVSGAIYIVRRGNTVSKQLYR